MLQQRSGGLLRFMSATLSATPRICRRLVRLARILFRFLAYISIAACRVSSHCLRHQSAVPSDASPLAFLSVSSHCHEWELLASAVGLERMTTLLKCVAFVALIVACLFVPARQHPTEGSIAPSITFSGVVIALQAIVITYGGWQSPFVLQEEVGIRRAIFLERWWGVCFQ